MIPRLLLIALIIVAVVLLWKAFGPKTWNRGAGRGIRGRQGTQAPPIKGPDDDPEFLWKLEKERFKERRAREEREEREKREKKNKQDGDDSGDKPDDHA